MKYEPLDSDDGIVTCDDVNVLAPGVSGGVGSDASTVSFPCSDAFVPMRMRVTDCADVVSPTFEIDDDTVSASPGAAVDLLSVIAPAERSTCDVCVWQVDVVTGTEFESVVVEPFVARMTYV